MRKTIHTLLCLLSLLTVLLVLPQETCAHKRFSEESLCDALLPKREFRGVWLTTIGGLDWPSVYSQSQVSKEKQQAELCHILDDLEAAGVNVVFLQTRIRGTVIYPSNYEPWDGCLSGHPGVSPGYDALQFAIDECHKRGMQLHAWVVTIPLGKWNKEGCRNMRKLHPELCRKIGEDGYMNPENPKTGDIIAAICKEIVSGYDIDGIHLDYIRYPETWPQVKNADKARSNITSIVEKVSDVVLDEKPWVMVSCSPIGKYDDLPRQWSHGWNARSRVYQDAQMWLKEDLMDALCPMMYFKDQNFYPFAQDWQEQSEGKIIAPGLGIYFMSPREKNWSLGTITDEMKMLRHEGMGHCYFRSRFFTDNVKGIYNFAHDDFDRTLSLVPAMTWKYDGLPEMKGQLTTDSLKGELRWQEGRDKSGATYLLYNIYRSHEWPVDISNPHNLIKRATRSLSLSVPLDGHFYAVTCMDRYGNESLPLQNLPQPSTLNPQPSLLIVRGNKVKIDTSKLNNSDVLSLQTLQGSTVKTQLMAPEFDLHGVKDGVYVIRSLGRKSNHRILTFALKRARN